MRQVFCTILIVFALSSPALAQQQPPTAIPVGVVKAERRSIAQSGEYVGGVEAISRVTAAAAELLNN
jgi:membrane fusion protein, multidrug efflux system